MFENYLLAFLQTSHLLPLHSHSLQLHPLLQPFDPEQVLGRAGSKVRDKRIFEKISKVIFTRHGEKLVMKTAKVQC